MNARGIIDTGAILAILNPRDHWHERCTEANDFETYRIEGKRKFRIVPSR